MLTHLIDEGLKYTFVKCSNIDHRAVEKERILGNIEQMVCLYLKVGVLYLNIVVQNALESSQNKMVSNRMKELVELGCFMVGNRRDMCLLGSD